MSGERIGNSNQFLSISGVVSAPAYSWASDNNTGIYRIGANNIGVAADGAKVLDIATTGLTVTGTGSFSGNLLVGTVSTSGAATNAAILAGGIFRTVTDTTSIPINTPTTIFAHQSASWLVTAYSEATGYSVTGIVTATIGGPNIANLAQYPTSASAFSISGANVQLTFGALSTYNATWNAIRIG